MANFIKVVELTADGSKTAYLNLDNVTEIRERRGQTEVYYVGDSLNYSTFNIPFPDFMDLVNSAK